MKSLLVLLCAFLAACSGCQPTPSPGPVPAPPGPILADAAPIPAPTPTPPPAPAPVPTPAGDAYDESCNNLQKVGCSEGKSPNCAASMRQADKEAVTRKPLDLHCFTTAKTVSAVRACGFVKCLP